MIKQPDASLILFLKRRPLRESRGTGMLNFLRNTFPDLGESFIRRRAGEEPARTPDFSARGELLQLLEGELTWKLKLLWLTSGVGTSAPGFAVVVDSSWLIPSSTDSRKDSDAAAGSPEPRLGGGRKRSILRRQVLVRLRIRKNYIV